MNWREICLERVRERNQIEKYPYESIYKSNTALYRENLTLDIVHSQTMTQLALLHHELNEYSNRGDYQAGSNLCYQRLYVIEEEMRRRHSLNPDAVEEDKVAITKLMSNLKLKVSNQGDEIMMAKSELHVYQERVISLEAEIEALKLAMMSSPARPATSTHSIKDRRPSSASVSRK